MQPTRAATGADIGKYGNHQGCLRRSRNFRWFENRTGRRSLCLRESRRRGTPDALVRMGCPSGLDRRASPLGEQDQIAMECSGMMVRTGTWTAALLLASALGASTPAAFAAEPNCRSIESANARLSCYDAAFPPRTGKPAEASMDLSSRDKDPFLAEETRTAAKLKNICRGC